MASAVKRKLSYSTNGRNIKLGSTSTNIHTAISGTTDGSYDELWLYACNTSSVVMTLTVEFGGTTNPDDRIIVGIAAQSGLMLVIPGFPLQNGCVVSAFGSVTNTINVNGFVNRIHD
jgi:hypothetical protein